MCSSDMIGLFKDFCVYSSACCLPLIGSARNTCVRVFWIIVFIGACTMFGYQLYLMITKYLSYPINVSTAMMFETQDFPVGLL
jgi:hypothetical protein